MKIHDLNTTQKEQFCRACAVVIFYEETDIAYSNGTDFLDITVPEDFDFTDGYSGELYQKVQEVYTDTMYIRLLFDATYDENNFEILYSWNKGFVFAMAELSEAEPMNDNDFGEFCDSIMDSSQCSSHHSYNEFYSPPVDDVAIGGSFEDEPDETDGELVREKDAYRC
jgi:hypothetical protein